MAENNLDQSFAALLAEARQGLGERPTSEKLLAYHRRELSDEDAELVQEYLAKDPTLALLFLDLIADPTESDEDAGLLSEDEMKDDLASIRSRIPPPPKPIYRIVRSPVVAAMAASLALASLALFGWKHQELVATKSQIQELQKLLNAPVPNVAPIKLQDRRYRSGGGREPIQILLDEGRVRFAMEVGDETLAVIETLSTVSTYRLEVRSQQAAAGSPPAIVVPGIVRQDDDRFYCSFPAGSLQIGEQYLLQLYTTDSGAGDSPVAEWDVAVVGTR